MKYNVDRKLKIDRDAKSVEKISNQVFFQNWILVILLFCDYAVLVIVPLSNFFDHLLSLNFRLIILIDNFSSFENFTSLNAHLHPQKKIKSHSKVFKNSIHQNARRQWLPIEGGWHPCCHRGHSNFTFYREISF